MSHKKANLHANMFLLFHGTLERDGLGYNALFDITKGSLTPDWVHFKVERAKINKAGQILGLRDSSFLENVVQICID